MGSVKFIKKIEHLLSLADVQINGDRSWDIQVYNEKLYQRVLAQGSLGLGEAYMDGWWDCEKLDEFICRIFKANLDTKINPWIRQYIFPNSVLPSAKQINDVIENIFVLEDWHNFGPDYDKTLMHWFQNFHNSWHDLKEQYDERFYRMWKYYLLASAGTFRSRVNQLWQIVLSPKGVPGGYCSPR